MTYKHAEKLSASCDDYSPLKLQFCLWFSAFMFDTMNDVDQAIMISEDALNEAG